MPGYELKLCDAGGHEVPDGEEGVLWVRGQSSAPLYWNRPEQTAKTMRGDWICTGDRFVRDGDEFYYFRGRADDLFKVSGQWVYPLEVELCLAGHEMVREVAVVGHRLPDARMALKAYVVTVDPNLEPDAVKRELRKFVKQKLLPHKSPRLIEFMPELPKTGTGKIDRQALKARAGEPMQ